MIGKNNVKEEKKAKPHNKKESTDIEKPIEFSPRLKGAIDELMNVKKTFKELKKGQGIVLFIGDGERVTATDITKLPSGGQDALLHAMNKIVTKYLKELYGMDIDEMVKKGQVPEPQHKPKPDEMGYIG